MPEIITPAPSIDSPTVDGSTDTIGEPTTFAISETIPRIIESFNTNFPSKSLSSDLPSETTSIDSSPEAEPSGHGSLPEPTSLGSILTRLPDFTITLDSDIFDDCDRINITWSGTNISPPYALYYSTGMGDIRNASNLKPETMLDSINNTFYDWIGPYSSSSKRKLPSFSPPFLFYQTETSI
jgi:hypothetical protein